MTNQTAVDYVRASLDHDFGPQAPIIQTWLENRMEDLAEEWVPITCGEHSEFQSVLELLAYPFLACYKALIDSDLPERQAQNYCQRI